MAALQSFLVCVIFAFAAILIPTSTSAQLTADFYQNVCPGALPTIRSVVRRAIRREPRMGASLLRQHFHDCFVNVSMICNFLKMCFLSTIRNV